MEKVYKVILESDNYLIPLDQIAFIKREETPKKENKQQEDDDYEDSNHHPRIFLTNGSFIDLFDWSFDHLKSRIENNEEYFRVKIL